MVVMSRMKIPTLCVFLCLLTACGANIKTEFDQNTDFSDYHRFSWIAPERTEVSDPILDSQLLSERVHRAVTQVLGDKGYQRVSDAPDFLITYHTASKSKLRTSPFSVSFGYSRFYSPWEHSVIFNDPQMESYEEGILMLDVTDAHTNRLIWRGWDRSILTQENFSDEAIMSSVTDILARFPPM